jgi:hypothetical protein
MLSRRAKRGCRNRETVEFLLRSPIHFEIHLIKQNKKEAFRLWCGFSFLLVLVSTTIFVILTVSWRGEDLYLTLAYFIAFPGHLLYRCVVLFFCLRFTRMDFTSMVL